ncbi:hypothetical protein MPER_08875, partial [Moniliophthora perniciosa FA553]
LYRRGKKQAEGFHLRGSSAYGEMSWMDTKVTALFPALRSDRWTFSKRHIPRGITTPVRSSTESHWDLAQKVSRLVTHRFSLVDTKHAFEVLAKGRDENGGVVLKIVIGSGQV